MSLYQRGNVWWSRLERTKEKAMESTTLTHVFGSDSDLCLYCGCAEGFLSRNRGKVCSIRTQETKTPETAYKEWRDTYGFAYVDPLDAFMAGWKAR